MKYKLLTVASLVLSVISLICAITSERRARVAAERDFASQRVELERAIAERVQSELLPKMTPSNAVVLRRAQATRQPDVGLWQPMLPPRRLD